jgi:hypothetical protein
MRRRNVQRRGLVAVAIGALGLLAACTRPNPDYCDSARPCGDGFVCQRESHSCVAELDCSDGGCVCSTPADCPSATADCVGGACQACASGASGDEVCRTSDAEVPICRDGACVACLVSDDCVLLHGDEAPHCDPLTFACGPCQRDDECAAGVCDEESGSCLAHEALLHVAAGGDDAGDCTFDVPCATVGGAVAKVSPARSTVVVHGDSAPHVETIVLDGAAHAVERVTVVGAVGERPSFLPSPDQPGLKATGVGAELRVERIELRDSNRAGVDCRLGARLRLSDVIVRGNETLGIDASDGCELSLLGSQVVDNNGGGVRLSGVSDFTLLNDLIARNGNSGLSFVGGVAIESPSGTMEFCTISENRVGSGDRAPGVACNGGLSLGNNLLWNNRRLVDAATIQRNVSGDCTHRFSLVGGGLAMGLDGGDNLDADPLFEAGGTFHLGAGSPAIDAADPAATLAVDIDGELRPAGERRDIGADERP